MVKKAKKDKEAMVEEEPPEPEPEPEPPRDAKQEDERKKIVTFAEKKSTEDINYITPAREWWDVPVVKYA